MLPWLYLVFQVIIDIYRVEKQNFFKPQTIYSLFSCIIYALLLSVVINYEKMALVNIFSRPIAELLTIFLLAGGYHISKKFYLFGLGNKIKEKRLQIYMHYIAFMSGAVLLYLTATSIIERLV